MKVALIDYEAGNIHSAQKAIERAGQDAGIDLTVTVTSDPQVVAEADRIVLPGDGAFGDCAKHLRDVDGMVAALEDGVLRKGKPFLGICVGLQLLATRGLEHGVHYGLGWVPGEVRNLAPHDPKLKIPHMGWNTLRQTRPHALLDGIPVGPTGLHAYFLHAYHLVAENHHDVLAEADYGEPITAIVARDSMVGMQFHPEKSQRLGLLLLGNFLRWRP